MTRILRKVRQQRAWPTLYPTGQTQEGKGPCVETAPEDTEPGTSMWRETGSGWSVRDLLGFRNAESYAVFLLEKVGSKCCCEWSPKLLLSKQVFTPWLARAAGREGLRRGWVTLKRAGCSLTETQLR